MRRGHGTPLSRPGSSRSRSRFMVAWVVWTLCRPISISTVRYQELQAYSGGGANLGCPYRYSGKPPRLIVCNTCAARGQEQVIPRATGAPRLGQASCDRLLESFDNGDHTTLIGLKTKTARIRIVKSGWPRANDAAVHGVILKRFRLVPGLKLDEAGRKCKRDAKLTYLKFDQLQRIFPCNCCERVQLLLDRRGKTRKIYNPRVWQK